MTEISSYMLNVIAGVMTNSFIEDPLMQEVFNGIPNMRDIIFEHSRLQLDFASQNQELIFVDDNPLAFLIGVDSKHEKKFAESWLYFRIMLKTLNMLRPSQILKILANNNRASRVLSLSWQKKFVKGRYYHIKIIAIDKEQRGTGIFRRLISPVIEYCDLRNIPIVLETHNPNNVPIYERFGFKVVDTRSAPGMDLKQYCMLRPAAG